jgi:hypothetical protein
MRRPPRIAVLSAVLVAVGAWIAVNPQRPTDATQATVPPRAAIVRAVARRADPEHARLPVREALAKLEHDPFSQPDEPPPMRQRVAVSAAAPVATVAPPAPPPFPFRFLGRVWLPTGTQVVLGRGDDAFAVKEGDALDDQYRVEKVGATELVVVHVPTATRSTIQFGVPEDAS